MSTQLVTLIVLVVAFFTLVLCCSLYKLALKNGGSDKPADQLRHAEVKLVIGPPG